MSGLQYGGRRGGQYGGQLGGRYGPIDRSTRIELYPPGATSPEISTQAVISIEIGLEHTAFSTLSIKLPPFEGITPQRYTDGQIAYHANGNRRFLALIQDFSRDNSNAITLSGPAVEDKNLDIGSIEETYGEVLTIDAIQDILDKHAAGYEHVVRPPPSRPISEQLVQRASSPGDFEAMLSAGSNVEGDEPQYARDIREAASGSLTDDVIPSLHETTPIAVTSDGLTTTQTAAFAEGERPNVWNKLEIRGDTSASGGEAGVIIQEGDMAGYDFGFDHDIPKGYFTIAYRARIGSTGPASHDRLEFSINGSVLATQYTSEFINYAGDYRWYTTNISYDDDLPAVPDDDKHRVEIEKVEGDDEVYVDCLAFYDGRFPLGVNLNETVNSNGALTGPDLYPNNFNVLFDSPKAGASIDTFRWSVDTDVHTDSWTIGVIVPKTGTSDFGGFYTDGAKTAAHINHNTPDNTTIVTGYGVGTIDHYTDGSRTETPLTNTESQTITSCEMSIDGQEISVISDEENYQGSPFDVLTDLHEYANRRFTIEHGVEAGEKPRFESFAVGDSRRTNGSSEQWVVTEKSRDVVDEGYANVVAVVGAYASDGTFYRGIARDEAAIKRLDEQTPADDDGVRRIRLRDTSLTSDNDCLSKARAELRERSRLKIGGELQTAPLLIQPGYPYYLQPFRQGNSSGEEGGYGLDYGLNYGGQRYTSPDQVGYGQNYGELYGVGTLEASGGTVSTLDSLSYSISAGSASSSLSFERPSGLMRAFEEIADASDPLPSLEFSTAPTVISAGPSGDGDDSDGGGDTGGGDNGDGGGDESQPGDPTATYSYSPYDPSAGETIEFDAAASGDEDGTISSYEWDFGDGTTATGIETTHSYADGGSYTVTLTVTDNDGNTDSVSQTVDVAGGTEDAIAYLSDDPLSDAAWELGGSAGPGTHGGSHVERPADMPTKAEADYIVRTGNGLRSAINNAGNGDVIYIDDDCNISGLDAVYLPPNAKLVGGFCDPNRTENNGRGPILYNHDSAPYNRRHINSAGPIEVWGVSFEGPIARRDTLEEKYFDPRNQPGDETDYYVSALWTYPEPNAGESLIYGCEFRGWHSAGLETGERTTPSNVRVERSTFINNCMETLGYGVEQWNGHLDMNLCYFDFNRHSISGFGYDTESWTLTNSMHGPNAISHAFDMHGLRQNTDYTGNLAGKFCKMENVTVPFTHEQVRNPGSSQEGFRIRGVSEQTTTIDNCHFYQSGPPNPPGEKGDPFYQTYPDQPNQFVNLTYGGNQYGERLEQGVGAPLNSPIQPQE